MRILSTSSKQNITLIIIIITTTIIVSILLYYQYGARRPTESRDDIDFPYPPLVAPSISCTFTHSFYTACAHVYLLLFLDHHDHHHLHGSPKVDILGLLVVLDVSGAPRIDDQALWILFGGGQASTSGIRSSSSNQSARRISSSNLRGRGSTGDRGSAPTTSRSSFNLPEPPSSSGVALTSPQPRPYGGGPRALKHLKLKWCNALSDSGTSAAFGLLMGQGGFALESLDVQGCPRLGDETVIMLARLQHELQAVWHAPKSTLKRVNLSGSAVSDYGLVLLIQRYCMFFLKSLSEREFAFKTINISFPTLHLLLILFDFVY